VCLDPEIRHNLKALSIALNDDVSEISASITSKQMKLNSSKCKVISITRKRNPIARNYSLNGVAIKRTDYERDLGVLVTNKLIWSLHVRTQCAKANKLLGLVRRSTYDLRDIDARRTLYILL
jgi:hypothetical protein